MGRLIRFIFSMTTLFVMVFMCGCKDNPTTPGSLTSTSEAYVELENRMYDLANTGNPTLVNFKEANKMYGSAAMANSNNSEARFGAGLTNILVIFSDPAMNNFLIPARLSQRPIVSLNKTTPPTIVKFTIPTSINALPINIDQIVQMFLYMVQLASSNPALLGSIQTAVHDYLLKYLDDALAHFEAVEQNPNFEFKVSGKMQGDTTLAPLYLDNTEVYILDGAIRGLKAMVEQVLVYRFDIPTSSPHPLVDALQPDNTTFFYRAPDGIAMSQNVLSDVLGMFRKFQNAITYLKSETDDQSDDILVVDDTMITAQSLDMMMALLDEAPNILLKDQTIRLYNINGDGYEYTIVVNISNLYNNPPQNPKKEWFPAYTVTEYPESKLGFIMRWEAPDYPSFRFPDPTFSGFFVNITNETTGETDKNENLKKLLRIEDTFYGRRIIIVN